MADKRFLFVLGRVFSIIHESYPQSVPLVLMGGGGGGGGTVSAEQRSCLLR